MHMQLSWLPKFILPCNWHAANSVPRWKIHSGQWLHPCDGIKLAPELCSCNLVTLKFEATIILSVALWIRTSRERASKSSHHSRMNAGNSEQLIHFKPQTLEWGGGIIHRWGQYSLVNSVLGGKFHQRNMPGGGSIHRGAIITPTP